MKVLVTGGNGWIGSATCRILEERGHEAVPFDRVSGKDIRNEGDLEIVADCDHVIHLAGLLGTHELFDRPHAAVEVNVLGTLNVLEACRKFDAGYTSIVMPNVNPSLYSATKNGAQMIAEAYRQTFNMSVSHVIAYNAFGPGQHCGPGHPQKILPTFATRAWSGRPIPIWGDGQLYTDLVHVDDVARMMADASKFGEGQIFDAGTGYPLTVLEVAEIVHAVTGDTGIEWLEPRPGERRERTHDDYAKGRGWDLLDWNPQYSRQAIQEAVVSYKDHPESLPA